MSKLFLIDLFCGAGGVTTGFEAARLDMTKVAEVLACVNHDAVAIDSHFSNHNNVKHFTEDIRTLDLGELSAIVKQTRIKEPEGTVCLWASLECTNFSKAKGGLPRDADSRTLAEHLFRYVKKLNPDYIMIENVEEFMSWGPLDENGKPVSRKNGRDYVKWCNNIQNYGYSYDFRLLNAADFGAYTSRKRLFIIFAKEGLPVSFPKPTHAKKPQTEGMFGKLQKWKAVRDVLDLNDHGNTIFGRKKDLSEKTLARIHAGLIKYIAGGKDAFLLKYNSINQQTGKHVPPGIDEPCPTVSTQGRIGVVQPQFISKYFSGHPESKNISVDGPAGAVKTKDSQSLITSEFLSAYYGNGDNVHDVNNPSPTVRTKDGIALVQAQFLDKNFSGKSNHQSIEQPAGTQMTKDKYAMITSQFIQVAQTTPKNIQGVDEPAGALRTVTKENLITAEHFVMDTQFNNNAHSIENPLPTITANRKYHYLINPSWFGNGGSVDEPCCTVVARQDKAPLYLVTTEDGFLAIEVFATDSEYTKKIKEFMALYGIVDIKMRMLKVNELLKIQGFPDGYILKGTQADQKKFIGNAVVPLVAQKIAEAIAERLNELEEKEVAA